MRSSRALLLLVLVAGTAPSLDAQARPPRRDPLSVRMDAFLAALEAFPRDTLLHFLPRRGPVTWVLTTRAAARPDRLALWRFGREDLLSAMDYPRPLCESFSRGGDAIIPGTLMFTAIEHPRGWRRVPGNRFVPPGASARSAVFVEWRRENGRWVLSAFGDERQARPRLLGREVNSVVRNAGPGPPPPTEPLLAAGTRWYEEHLPIVVDGEMLIKHGLPQAIEPELLERIGTLNGVAVYVEAGSATPVEVVYVPTAPGMYQPYQDMIGNGCP
ncbi:MAG: hypothetical protein KY467_02340 [Gemmatimonadetes bacterium]|nr:hypothetical protein [Gemmatimonadota bacterium]